MRHIYYMAFSILSWIYATECMEVIPERGDLVYMNPKYVYLNGTVNVRRYSRKSRYYVNVMVTNKQTWNNNITFTLSISQFLHNEYRPSFVEMSRQFCDFVNKEPFVGGALRNVGLECPLLPGHHSLMNITANTEHFPNVFPFEHGRVEAVLSDTDTKEQVLKINVVATFKQKLRGK